MDKARAPVLYREPLAPHPKHLGRKEASADLKGESTGLLMPYLQRPEALADPLRLSAGTGQPLPLCKHRSRGHK